MILSDSWIALPQSVCFFVHGSAEIFRQGGAILVCDRPSLPCATPPRTSNESFVGRALHFGLMATYESNAHG